MFGNDFLEGLPRVRGLPEFFLTSGNVEQRVGHLAALGKFDKQFLLVGERSPVITHRIIGIPDPVLRI